MKKWLWILPIALLVTSTDAFAAKSQVKPIEARKIENKDAKKEFKQGVKAFNNAKYDEAATHFSAAAQAEPNLPEIHINLAMALAQQGKADEAKKHFDEATSLLMQTASAGGATGNQQSGSAPGKGMSPGSGGMSGGGSQGDQGAASPGQGSSSSGQGSGSTAPRGSTPAP